MKWSIDEIVKTSAGLVAAGSTGVGDPLILAHGWPWSSYSWHRLIPSLSENFRVFWYDMPGYGKSEKNPDQLTGLDVQGMIFCELMQHWGLEDPIVIAHDFGGATSLRAHLLYNMNFSRYVLMNVVAIRPWGSDFFNHVGKHIEAFVGLPPNIHRALVEGYILSALVADLDSQEFECLVEPWLSEEGRLSFYRQFEQADEKYTEEIEVMYPEIRCPVKIIWGMNDPWIPLSRGESLHDLIKPESFKSLPDVGHLPQLEAPQLVLKELYDFLM